MAEMTAHKVKTLLESFAALCGSNSKAKELCGESIKFVEQQQQQIEATNSLLPDNYSESKDWKASNTVNKIDWLKVMYECKKAEIEQLEQQTEQQSAEIAKKDRMIDKACDRLSSYRKCPPEICDLPYHPGDVECFKHWRKWLEKEAQGVE